MLFAPSKISLIGVPENPRPHLLDNSGLKIRPTIASSNRVAQIDRAIEILIGEDLDPNNQVHDVPSITQTSR